ncbi:MAG: YbhN family protein [Oligoflexales bacterium]
MLTAIAKITIVLALIVWLVRSDRLDFAQLHVLITNPVFILETLFVWGFAIVYLGALRWHYLLKGSGYSLPFSSVIKLHLIGMFFNTAMPGSVGGDLVKVAYIVRENKEKGKVAAFMTVLLDRLLGVFALFWIGALIIASNSAYSFQNPQLSKISGIVVISALGLSALFAIGIFYRKSVGLEKVIPLIPGKYFLFKVLTALGSFRKEKKYIALGIGVSLVIQSIMTLYFFAITQAISDGFVDFVRPTIVFPIGVLTTVIPLAPGGLGVGHVAFEKLFQSVGLTGGANAFNIYALCILALNLLGAFPYVLFKKSLPQVAKSEGFSETN